MNRDFDLVRKLLIFFRDKEGPEPVKVPPIEGYSETNIKYHCVLLYDAEMLRCEPVTSNTSDRVIEVLPFELTWDGHEFADKILNETVWNRIREKIAASGGALAFSVIRQLATKYSLESVGFEA